MAKSKKLNKNQQILSDVHAALSGKETNMEDVQCVVFTEEAIEEIRIQISKVIVDLQICSPVTHGYAYAVKDDWDGVYL